MRIWQWKHQEAFRVLNMKISYKKLNAIFIEMAKMMKKNGECNLGANSLLDRFSKSAKLNSRQELKAALEKENQIPLDNLGSLVIESYKTAFEPKNEHAILFDTAQYMAKEYIGLLYREQYKNSILNHGQQGIEKYAEAIALEHMDSFLHDQRGLFFYELELEQLKKEKNSSYLYFQFLEKRSSDAGFNVNRLKNSRFSSIKEFNESLVKLKITEIVEDNLEELNLIASKYIYEHIDAPKADALTTLLAEALKDKM